MRRHSLTGPLMLLLIGAFFLWRNLHPEAPVFEMAAQYWPFALIAWGVLRLIEVALSRDSRWGSGFTGGEVVLVILICLAGSGIWHARHSNWRFNSGGLDWFGEQFDYTVSASGPTAGMTRVVFENPRGNIRIIGSDTQQVTVNGHKLIRAYSHSEADRTNEKTPIEIVPQGDRLLVRTNQDHAPGNQRISDDIEVTVPRGMAVESHSNTGDYDISDVTGDVELAATRADVRLARVGGNARLDIGRSDLIRADGVKGKIDLQGHGSDIDLENISGQVTINGAYNGTLDFKNLAKPLQFEGARNTELHVEAIPGRINMDLGSFTATGLVGPMRLVARSRDIKIAQFTQSLELETERGDIELQPGKLPLSPIEVRSGSGRIELVLPEHSAFQLQATAERGDAVNDFGPGITREVEGRTVTLKGKVGDGPAINVTSNRGSVSVRKEGTPPSEDTQRSSIKRSKIPVVNLKSTEVRM